MRLFARGHKEEPVFVELLRGAGFIVRVPYKDYEDGESDFKFSDCASHFRGTADGAISEDGEEWFLLECKTYNAKNFADLKRCGVKENDPKYYSQITVYQGQLGFSTALFCAVNKDNDDLYFEHITFDEVHFNSCLSKAETIINATTPPDRISNDPNTFTCRYCHFNKICHTNENIPTNQRHCRNCHFASPAAAGTWECHKGHTFGTLCADYQFVAGGS